MLADWSAECSADDPVLVLPWSDPACPDRRFIDLREDPYEIESIPEAEAHPPLRNALRSLNAPRSPVYTAKCDVWTSTDPDTLANLALELALDPGLAAASFSSYIDLLWRDRSLFASFHQHQHIVERLTRRAAPLDQSFATLDCIIRPAILDLTGPQEGFALSLYVKAVGSDASHAEANWATALDAVVLLFRSKDLVPNT
jgi:hypothetical protein